MVLDLSNYVIKKGLKHATGIDTSDWYIATQDFIALKAKVYILDINKLVNVPTGLNNLKTKLNNVDVD